MKKVFGLCVFCTLFILWGCTEEIDKSARYVFNEPTIMSYLSEHKQYSQYCDLLGKVKVSRMSETTLKQLLSARGNYTVFAPTNDAIDAYLQVLDSLGIVDTPSWDGFRDSTKLDSIRKVIVHNSVIDGGDLMYYEVNAFPVTQGAEIPMANMYDRKLVVHYGNDPDSITVNDAPIDLKNRDIIAINGVIHAVNSVVAPSNSTLSHLMSTIIDQKREGHYVASMLAKAVGMLDTLNQVRDEVYETLYQEGKISDISVPDGNGSGTYDAWAPEHRYYGFTYFAETDSFWRETLGKEPTELTPADVQAYVESLGAYPDAVANTDYQNENNLLNQFVTYHFLPMKLSTDRLVNHYNERGYSLTVKNPTVAMTEYYTTMGKRRLMKVFESRESNGVYINRFPNLDNGRHGSYTEVSCDPDKEGVFIGEPNLEGDNNVRNGIIYPIDKLLVYDRQTRENMTKGRVRWDVSAMFPELMNNDCRMSEITDNRHKNVGIPMDVEYKYFDDAWIEEGTYFFYWTGRGNGWHNYLGDEFNIQGMSELTLRLPPVPTLGTYELRFAVQSGGARGMVQFYWGEDRNRLAAKGIPLDIRLGAVWRNTTAGQFPSKLGWEKDTDDDDYNAEVDKKLRNNGFMKGANVYIAGSPGGTLTAREDEISTRRIIIRETMDPDKIYYLRFKTVLDDPTRQFYMDYLEYCAKEVYDNPEEPEDIW